MSNPVPNPTDNNIGSSQTGQHSEAYYEAQYLNNTETEIQNIKADMQIISEEVSNIEKLEQDIHNERTAMYNTMMKDYGSAVRHYSSLSRIQSSELRASLINCSIGEHDIIVGYEGQVGVDASAESNAANYITSVTGDQQIEQGLKALNVALGINSSSGDLSSAVTFLNTQTIENGKTIDLGIAIVSRIMDALKIIVGEKERNLEMKAKAHFHSDSENQLEENYLENMQDSLQANSLVESITSVDAQTADTLGSAIRAEKWDLNNHSTGYEILHSMGLTSSQKAEREERLNHQESLKAINTIGDGLSKLLGAFQTNVAFSQLTNMLNQLIAKMKKILNNKKMPLTEKLNAVLSLMTEVLAIFNMIQQTTENQKMENEKKMAAANQTQAKNSIQNALLNEKLLAHAVDVEKTAHVIQSVTTWLMLVVSAVTASPAFFLFMCVMASLQQSGDLGKWTNELGDKMGAKWKADLVMAAVEMGATGVFMAGEAAAKIAVKALMSEVVEEITESALMDLDRTALDTAIDEVQDCRCLSTFTDDDAADTLERVSRKAASMATQFVRDEFAALSPVAMAAKTAAGKGLVATTRIAIKKAIENAIEEAVLSAKSNVGNAIPEMEVSATAAAKAVSTVSTTTVEEAKVMMTRTAKGFFGNLKQFMREYPVLPRMLFTYAYGLGTSNFVMDIAKEEAKKKGKELDTLETILAGIAQAILTIIGMIGAMGSSSLDTGTEMNPILKFQKLAAAAQALGQLAGAHSEMEVAKVIKKQAQDTFNVKKEMTYQSILSTVLKSMQQAQNQGARQAANEWLLETKSLNKLSMHIQDADNAGIKVLTEQVV